ncbi:MAG: NIPSNAP family protein [Planctomycetota bacterium]
MRRREFVGAMGLAAAGMAAAAEAEGQRKQILELRIYQVAKGEKRERLDAFLKQAAIPAWNRMGIAKVGAFQDTDDRGPKLRNLLAARPKGESAEVAVLLAHPTLDAWATATDRLLADQQFQKAGAKWLGLPKKDPLYRRIEAQVMLAFDQCPTVETPTQAESRVFQLRTYESHSLPKAHKKIHMFNEGGEIALFRTCGMNPVFFGQTLAGARMPNLTYMLGFEDPAAQKAAWGKFMAHPGWKTLRSKPLYRDTVSNITNILLRPTAYSQI